MPSPASSTARPGSWTPHSRTVSTSRSQKPQVWYLELGEPPAVTSSRRRSRGRARSSRISSKAAARSAASLRRVRSTVSSERSNAGSYPVPGASPRARTSSPSSGTAAGGRRSEVTRRQSSQSVSRWRTTSRLRRRWRRPRPKRLSRTGCGWRLSILGLLTLPVRLLVEADGEELPGERGEAAVGDLADAGGAVAHLLRHLGRPVAEAVAQLEQRPAAGGEARHHAVQVGRQLRLLLVRRLRDRQEVEDRRVDRLAEAPPPFAPVHDALLLDRPDQPALRAADLVPLVQQRELGVLQNVLGILGRDLEITENPLQARSGILQQTVQRFPKLRMVKSCHRHDVYRRQPLG